MSRSITLSLFVLFLAGCNPISPLGGYEYKACQLELDKLPRRSELAGGDRLVFINRCMAEKGLRPSGKCLAAGAQGKRHCEYVQS
ncbi:hypothetical protein WG922_11615 [Ramlibacter sp. AN1015]|uniref:hypothetical protein n=1 Tax=Ramlibacter sp. AN1015 TaxID=3133428 RepID=UPI0030BE105C